MPPFVAFLARELAALLALGLTAHSTGLLIGVAWRLETTSRPERLAVRVALGLAAWTQVGFWFGIAGVLRPLPIAVLAVAVNVWGLRRAAAESRSEARHPPDWRAPVLLALGVVLPMFLLALYPPVVFDETLYHLPFARAFTASGGLPFLPELRVPVFPQLAEILQAEVLLLASDVATHFVSLLAVWTTGLLLIAWGRRRGSPRAGWLAAAVVVGAPQTVYFAGTAYVEPLLTLCFVAALHAAERWREGAGRPWLWVAGALAGTAAGIKYLGLFLLAWVALEVVLARRPRVLVEFALAAGATALPSYVRILAWTGNPLFPFLPRVFGDSPWRPSPGVATPGPRWAIADWILLPWSMVTRSPDGLPPFSPACLLGLPWLAAAMGRGGWARRTVAMAAIYAAVVPLHTRYLMPIIPPLALAAGAELESWLRRVWPRSSAAIAAVVCALLLAPAPAFVARQMWRWGRPPATGEERDRFWAARLPAYGAVKFVNNRGGGRAYGFHLENMVYLAQGVWLGDWTGLGDYQRFEPLLGDPPRLHAALRELDVEYLVVPATTVIDDAARFARVYEDRRFAVYAVHQP